MSKRRQRRAEGFTIVEMLVVIGVLALLIGLLLPALSGAQKRGQKLRELNALKQVDLAWRLYANSSADRAVPGFLELEVQDRWRVRFEYRNRVSMSPFAAGPWTWRLLPFMDYGYDMVLGYQDDLNDMTFPNFSPSVNIDVFNLDPGGTNMNNYTPHATAIAEHSGFGYNAYYIGGWWEWDPIDPDYKDIPRYEFYNATVDGRAKSVVRTSVGQIKRSSEVITFCSSALLPNGTYRKWPRDQAGWHWVSPPKLGEDEQWSIAGATGGLGLGAGPGDGDAGDNRFSKGVLDPTVLEVLGGPSKGAVPIGRYNRLAAVLHADGHTSVETPGALLDMRRWIDAADDRNFEHSGQAE